MFYTFYACFTNTETALNSKGSKHTKTRHEAYLRDLLEIVLPALEVQCYLQCHILLTKQVYLAENHDLVAGND